MKTIFIVGNEEDRELMVKLGKKLKENGEVEKVMYLQNNMEGYDKRDIKNINAFRMSEMSDEVIFITKLPVSDKTEIISPLSVGIEFNNYYLHMLAVKRDMEIKYVCVSDIK